MNGFSKLVNLRTGMFLTIGALLFSANASAFAAGPASQSTDAATSGDLYTSQVQPIFKSECYRCHAGLQHHGHLQLDTPEAITKGGEDGAVVVAGHPEKSLLVTLIRHENPTNDPGPMPPHKKLSDADIAVIEKWIKAGALMPSK